MNFRFFLFLIALLLTMSFLSVGYAQSKQKKIFVLDFDNRPLDSIMEIHGDNIAILSCLRCDCFREEYNKVYDLNNETPENYSLFADTNCIKLRFSHFYLSDSLANRISEDLYNLVFFKKNLKGEISYKILNVKESENIAKQAKRFFR